MKENNKSNVILIIAFILMITLPQIVFWATKEEKTNISTAENRKLNSKPEFKLSTITTYPKKFDNYYNDHLPYRTELRKFWTDINYEMFNTTVDSRVLIGKEGWLFYRANKMMEQTQGVLRSSEKEKANIVKNLQYNIGKFKEKGIETYIAIWPNKENIYREYLPDTITIKNNITKAEDLIKYIHANSDIDIIYPKEELLEQKSRNQVYCKYDTHWNKVGAFVGMIALQKEIDPNFEYDMNDMKVVETENKERNDLTIFAGLDKKIYEKEKEVENFHPEVEVKKLNNEYNSKVNDKTILLIGDSYSIDLSRCLAKLYGRVIYIYRDNWKEEMLEEINPDIVVIGAVERFSEAIGKKLLK